MNSSDDNDNESARFERAPTQKKKPAAEENLSSAESSSTNKTGTSTNQPWLCLTNNSGTAVGATAFVSAARTKTRTSRSVGGGGGNRNKNTNTPIPSYNKPPSSSSSSSSSLFKLTANFNFFSSDKLHNNNDDEEHFFLSGGEGADNCSPSIYLIENSQTVSNHNMNSTDDDSSSCRSVLMDADNSENDYEDDETEREENDIDVVDTATHFRKIFEKNVVRVKRPRYFLSLPDLRPVRWLSAHDYFYYSVQDITDLYMNEDDDEFDDDEDDNAVVTTTVTYTNDYQTVDLTSNYSLKDEDVLVGDQQPVVNHQSDSSDDDDQQQQKEEKVGDDGAVAKKDAGKKSGGQDSADEEVVFHDSGSEEISWSQDGENEIRTLVKLKRNALNRSWEKTTVVTTFFPDGQQHTDTYYETLFDDDDDGDEDDEEEAARGSDEEEEEDDLTALDDEAVRRRYEKSYQLRGNQYDLLKKCFRKMESSGLISLTLLKAHIQVQVKDRSRLIRADQETIERTLNTIDTDKDENVSFQEFLDYLYLFFASKKNFRTKIVNILNGHKRKHLARGSLTEREARQYLNLMARFYGLKDEEKKKVVLNDLQSYSDFAEKVYPVLEEKLFVTWL